MPRTCPPAVWARLLGDHGPDDAMLKHCLLTLRTWMDQQGYGFPSQLSIAKRASVSEKTVQKKLDKARRLHWIGVYSHGNVGQQWRRFSYQTCIPDHVDVNDKDEHLLDTWASQIGDVEGPELQRGPSSSSSERSGTSGHKVQNVTTKGPEREVEKVPPDVLTKSSSESSQVKSSSEGALKRTRVDSLNGKQKNPEAEVLHGAAKNLLKPPPRINAYGEPLDDDKLKHYVGLLFKAGNPPSTIVTALCNRAHHDRIRRCLANDFGVPWISSP